MRPIEQKSGRSGRVSRAGSAHAGRRRDRDSPGGFRGDPQAAEGRCAEPRLGPAPVWLAALSAATCRAGGDGGRQAVSWSCISGRAVYTNAGLTPETIHPLGVRLERGQTLAVWWMPGDTGYSMEICGRQAPRA